MSSQDIKELSIYLDVIIPSLPYEYNEKLEYELKRHEKAIDRIEGYNDNYLMHLIEKLVIDAILHERSK